MKKNVCIVIPIYKKSLDANEAASLRQCFKILFKYDVYFVCPHLLEPKSYRQISLAVNKEVTFEYFNSHFFLNIDGYNSLLISKEFYKRFDSYEYLLIYQLDAWVFKDELKYWCNKGYDYIGAPWYEGYTIANDNSKFIGVGNGGFSLRKVSSHLKVLNSFAYIKSPHGFMKNLSFKNKINPKNLLKLISNFTITNNSYYLFNDFDENEDYFWCFFIKNKFQWFKTPEENEAAKFATEKKAAIHYKNNNSQLPFGCHAWFKYEQEFWNEHIKLDYEH